ncbi:MAG: dihydroxyacetone kinase subunit DhaL [Eubacteriales bacterium]|nr:dihydroxyacetone kinase subunit DhaL [Eubacteriales bacterium]
MGFKMSSADYVDYINYAAKIIEKDGEYITALDAATGDGDHWINMDTGLKKLVSMEKELSQLSLQDMMKKIGMTMMSVIGGSAGVLYGGSYIAASKVCAGKDVIDCDLLGEILEAMRLDIMNRNKSEPGFKTMLDALYPAVEAFKSGKDAGLEEKELLALIKQAADEGSKSTAAMEAVRGRACYQADKGVGHIDPGSVTMAYLIGALCDWATKLSN